MPILDPDPHGELPEPRRTLANVHDVFLSVSLLRSQMMQSPPVQDTGLVHPRWRLERLWVAMMRVLIESWRSQLAEPLRQAVEGLSSTRVLEDVLARHASHIDSTMRETRGYMFHRDSREYWDIGRIGPVGSLQIHEEIHSAFSNAFHEWIDHVASQSS